MKIPIAGIKPHPRMARPRRWGPVIVTRTWHLLAGSEELERVKASGETEVEVIHFEDLDPWKRSLLDLRMDAQAHAIPFEENE